MSTQQKFNYVVKCIMLLFLLSGVCFSEFKKTKIAVIDFTVQGSQIESDFGQIASEWLITAFVKEGRFDVVERNLLNKIIEEQSFSKTGMVASESVVQLGKILGVQVMITGSVMNFQDYIELNTRIIDVKDASILIAENVKGSNVRELKELVLQMAKKIISAFPLRGYVVDAGDQGITIDLGRTSGVKTDMNFSIFKEGKIIKHPKTGAILDIETIETGVIKITSVREKISIGTIVSGNNGSKIEYGQKVKSVPTKGKEKRETTQSLTNNKSVESVPNIISYGQQTDPYTLQLINDLKSTNMALRVRTAKTIYKRRLYRDEILNAVKELLLNSLNSTEVGRYYADSLGYCCKIIYASKRSEYKDVLYAVSIKSQIRKVRNYASKYYDSMR